MWYYQVFLLPETEPVLLIATTLARRLPQGNAETAQRAVC